MHYRIPRGDFEHRFVHSMAVFFKFFDWQTSSPLGEHHRARNHSFVPPNFGRPLSQSAPPTSNHTHLMISETMCPVYNASFHNNGLNSPIMHSFEKEQS